MNEDFSKSSVLIQDPHSTSIISNLSSEPSRNAPQTPSRFLPRFSVDSVALSIATILPEYSAVDTLSSASASEARANTTTSTLLPRYVDINTSSDAQPSSPNYEPLPQRHGLSNSTSTPTPPSIGPKTYKKPRIAPPCTLSGSVPHFEHSFTTLLANGKSRATLNTFSPASIPGMLHPSEIKPELPLFYEQRPVAGMLQLELEGPQKIQEIMITVRGAVMSGYVGDVTKISEYKFCLWHKLMGDPSRSSSIQGEAMKNFNGKLAGSYQFPFSFPFPTQPYEESPSLPEGAVALFPLVTNLPSNLPSGSAKKAAPVFKGDKKKVEQEQSIITSTRSSLPSSFDENKIMSVVHYEIFVNIVHGRFKSDTKVGSLISYMPLSIPPPPPPKRQEAYRNNTKPPGPLTDPQEWVALPKTVVRGDLRRRKFAVNIQCSLYLAKPLSYTRGAFIPCFLALESKDPNTLAAVFNPKTLHVHLVRRVSYLNTHRNAKDYASGNQSSGAGNAMKTTETKISVATWWVPANDDVDASSVRHLEGEIQLAPDLKPTSTFPLFMIQYYVEFLSFASGVFDGGFQAGDQVLLSCPVEITTLSDPHFPEPVPFSKTPNSGSASVPSHRSGEWSDALLLVQDTAFL